MKILFLLLFLSCHAMAGVITPSILVETTAPVLDFVIRQNTIWAGTANGQLLQLSLQGKRISSISLPLLKNHWGEQAPQRVMSVDVSHDGKTIVMAAEDGCLYVVRDGKAIKTAYATPSVIKKIVLLSESRVMIALLCNEMILFDLNQNKVIQTLSAGTSPLSDMAASSDRKHAFVAGEAGIVSMIDTTNLTMVRQIKGGNVDNIYKIDVQNGFVMTAGQDRRAIIYTMAGKIAQRFDGSFLIYSVALSPSANRAVAALDELNSLSVFDVKTGQLIATAEGHQATLNRIVFIDEKRFVSCADENKILFWELP